MFHVGEHIIHPGQGVCMVTGFEEGACPMIVLETKQGHARTKLLYPLEQADRLHLCISKSDAETLIANYRTLECDPFTGRNSSLEESYFKQQIKQGAPATLRVAKTMRQRIAQAEQQGKKPSSYYMRILKEAHRRATEELVAALGCSEEDVNGRFVAAGIETIALTEKECTQA